MPLQKRFLDRVPLAAERTFARTLSAGLDAQTAAAQPLVGSALAALDVHLSNASPLQDGISFEQKPT